MLRKIRYIQPNYQYYLLAKRALTYLLLIFWGFSFWSEQRFALTNDFIVKGSVNKHCALLSTAGPGSIPHAPFSHPYTGDTFCEEPETANETGPEEDAGMECDNLPHHPSAEDPFRFSRQAILFSQISGFTGHSKTPPLFILHHSWKSFLV